MSDRQQGVVCSYPHGDRRQIYLDDKVEHDNDKHDILDLVRQRIRERKLKPIEIRRSGVPNWNKERHWRLRTGYYDCDISMKVAYHLAVACGLKRTKVLPFDL